MALWLLNELLEINIIWSVCVLYFEGAGSQGVASMLLLSFLVAQMVVKIAHVLFRNGPFK